MNANEKRAWIILITTINALVFLLYFHYVYLGIPEIFDGSLLNILTGILLFITGVHYVFMLSWFSVVCSEGEDIFEKQFFAQIFCMCFWGFCINVIHGQWNLLVWITGLMVFWVGIAETFFSSPYDGIPHPRQEEPVVVVNVIPGKPQTNANICSVHVATSAM